MKSIIRIGLLLIVGIIAYNYFAGTTEEKETSREIINTAKDLGAATWDLLKSEKQKFDEGKYDGVIEDAKGLFSSLKEKARELNDTESLEKLEDLGQRRDELAREMEKTGEMDPELKARMEAMLQETEQLMQKMNQGN